MREICLSKRGGVSEEIESAGKLKSSLRHKLVLKELSVERAGRIASILNEAVEKNWSYQWGIDPEERKMNKADTQLQN